MNKEEYKMKEEIHRLINTLHNEIKRKEKGIEILKAEISQLYDFINEVERLAEILTNKERINESNTSE